MPLYIGDYLKDTGRLTTEQHGAYILLIMDYWTNGPLEDDEQELASIARLDIETWRGHRRKIERFFTVEGGQWFHKRIEEELIAARGKANKAAERAQTAANARWSKGKPDDAPGNASSNARSTSGAHARGMLEECPSPSPSPSSSVSNETGAEPPKDALADERALPVAKGCWRLAVRVLVEHGEKTDAQARSIVGKLKAGGLTDDELWRIGESAWQEGTLDPVPYLTKAAERTIADRGSIGVTTPSPERQRSWMGEFVDKPHSWNAGDRGPRPGAERCRVSPEIQREFGVEPFDGGGFALRAIA